MARIYAEAAEKHGKKVEVAVEKEVAAKDDAARVEESKETDAKSDKPEQEVIVLRGGFTRW